MTPQQISNLQKELRDDDDAYDFDALDGFDEVNPESCNKIREAVEAGHVADEDWKGDLEMNRPGKRGTRVKTPKKKAAEEDVSLLSIFCGATDLITAGWQHC